jgi:fucose permease
MTAETTVPARAAVSSARAANRPRLPLGLSFFAFVLIGANDGAVGVLLPSIIAHYGITKATASLLFPLGAVGYLVAALGSGLLLERLGRRAFLMLGTGVFTTGAAVVLAAPSFSLLLPAFLLIGFGLGILDAGLNAYVAGLPRSAGLLNYLHAFYGAGALLGPLIASTILVVSGHWNVTYLVWVVAAALVLVGFRFAIGAPERPVSPVAGAVDGAGVVRNPLTLALRLPVVWLAAAFLFVYVGAEVSLGAWSYSLLTQGRHLPALPASWMVSGYWLGLMVGRIAVGRVADRWGVGHLLQWCIAGVFAAVVLVWVAPAGAFAALGLWVAGFCLGPIFPSTIALIDATAPARVQQSAIGLAASLGAMGSAVFPWLAGNLVQRAGLLALLPFVAGLTLALYLLWLALRHVGQTP